MTEIGKHSLRAAVAASLMVAASAQAQTCAIDNPGKIGVGTWPVNGPTAQDHNLWQLRLNWWYDWQPTPTSTRWGYVPMIWSPAYINYAASAPGRTLLTFNEPDNKDQANMTPQQAIAWWPQLMATRKRLSSPAVQTGNELGSKWLGVFMEEAKRLNYRVDFIAVHYYPTTPSVTAFKTYLEDIHKAYGKPIWVTEWSLADWKNQTRFTAAQQAAFYNEATEMMDDLPYVERHAWFGLYPGMDGWNINSELITANNRSVVGNAFRAKVLC